jgi:hypothetical protein
MVELKAVAISVLSPVAVAQHAHLSMPQSVGDLGAVQRAHSSISSVPQAFLRAVVQI